MIRPSCCAWQTGSKNHDCQQGLEVYKQFDTVVFLREVVRLQGPEQEEFRNLLLTLRDGPWTQKWQDLLETRMLGEKRGGITKAEAELFKKGAIPSFTAILPYGRTDRTRP